MLHVINEFRRQRGWNDEERKPLELHLDESASCKAHAQWMADHEHLAHAPPGHYVSRGWQENVHAARFAEEHLYQVVEKMIWGLKPEDGHYQSIIGAREFVAADVALRAPGDFGVKQLFLCMRFK